VILALETSTAAASAAVAADDGELLGASLTTGGPLQARRLLDGVHEALSAAGVDLDEVSTIVCGLGPGTFTGLRIGVATARALAQAAGLPLAGVPSLEALARGLADAVGQAPRPSAEPAAGPGPGPSPGATVVPLIDGRRSEVFAAVYHSGRQAGDGSLEALEPVVGLTVVDVEALPAFLECRPGAVVGGDGALLYADRLPAGVTCVRDVAGPSALMVARTFLSASGAVTRGFDATLPIYGREPDALPRAHSRPLSPSRPPAP
jgi:tRNA threonylcarbamoyladenosine biosynthesis protein TsaB